MREEGRALWRRTGTESWRLGPERAGDSERGAEDPKDEVKV